jgi:TRAP-type mannitol/chloroaromatic compound transport system substrate-binding protein
MRSRVTSALGGVLLAGALVAGAGDATAQQTYKMRLQAAVPTQADEFKLLQWFGERVKEMSNGRLTVEVLPDGAIVGAFEILDAVHKGLVEAGFAWTHYWSGKHPAATLFGSPAAGAGLGIDQQAFVSWYLEGEGKQLYQELFRDHLKLNVVGFILQPVGPEALGWFKEPINSLDDLRKRRFRTPPGIPGAIYKSIGVPAIALPGAEIIPSAERGVLDGAEWCCPATDLAYGFHRVFKYYYLQGLHQSTVNGDIYINKAFWDKLPKDVQAIVDGAATASMTYTLAYRILKNAEALKVLVNQHGVKLMDTPKEYFPTFMKAAKEEMAKNAAQNEFFKKVFDSQARFAETVVPYWARVQALSTSLGQAALEK